MVKSGLFHVETGFPNIALPFGDYPLTPTGHARRAAAEEEITLPDTLFITERNIVEIGIEGGRVNHLVVRVPYNERYDLVLALTETGTVKTVWLNDKTDAHKTLNKSRYTTMRLS